MYNTLINVFAIIGVLVVLLFLCKFVFLLILAIRRSGRDNKYWSIERHQMCSDNYENSWFLIPTIDIHTCNEYLEVSVKFLRWEYYTNYKLSTEV